MSSEYRVLRLVAVRLMVFSCIFFAVVSPMGAVPALSAKAAVTVGGPFTLTAQDGMRVTEKTYRGKWLLVFFGYTSCTDVCPLTLSEIAGALAKLGPDAARVQPILITLDPQRDTPGVMGTYTEAFDARIVGLTGSPDEIAAIAREYGAYGVAGKSTGGAGDYHVDHSTYIYLMDPGGKFVRGFAFNTQGDSIAEAVRKLMAQYEKGGAPEQN